MRLQINLRWFLILTATLGVVGGLVGRRIERRIRLGTPYQQALRQAKVAEGILGSLDDNWREKNNLPIQSGSGAETFRNFSGHEKKFVQELFYTIDLLDQSMLATVHLQIETKAGWLGPEKIAIKDYGAAANQQAIKELTAAFDKNRWKYRVVKEKPIQGKCRFPWPKEAKGAIP